MGNAGVLVNLVNLVNAYCSFLGDVYWAGVVGQFLSVLRPAPPPPMFAVVRPVSERFFIFRGYRERDYISVRYSL